MHLYAIVNESAKAVKIGKAVDPDKRLRLLQTGNHSPLTLRRVWRDCGKYERDVHRYFWHSHKRGEWFAMNECMALFVETADTGFIRWIRERDEQIDAQARAAQAQWICYVNEAAA